MSKIHPFPIQTITVSLDFGTQKIMVGRLAQTQGKIYFQYDEAFLQRELEISPLHLSCSKELYQFDTPMFEGLAGVFDDSLADGWGRLLFDRWIRQQNVSLHEVTPLDRLAYVGSRGMGALTYAPDFTEARLDMYNFDLDDFYADSQQTLQGGSESVLETLLTLNGSSHGARPKVLVYVSEDKSNILYDTKSCPSGYAPWIIKFPNSHDGVEVGQMEFDYAHAAKKAGIVMPDVHLFESKNGDCFFGVKRFDTDGHKRWHMHTAAGLLHADFRAPALDYQDLMRLTLALTKDMRDAERLFRLSYAAVSLSHTWLAAQISIPGCLQPPPRS